MSTDAIIHTDVAVVGAGLAGLTAARLLRDGGRRVAIVEPAFPGGRGRTDLRHGALLNRGPHAVYVDGPAERTLRGLGLALSGGAPTGRGGVVRDGTVHELPGGLPALLRTTALSSRGKVALARLMARIGRVRTDGLAGVTFGAWLDGLGLPDDARSLVEMLGRIASYAHAPDTASAEMVVCQVQMAMRSGVRYLDGGWQAIVDQLLAGAEVLSGTAHAVEPDGRGVEVRLVDGRAVRASAVVVSVGTPAATSALLRVDFTVGPPIEASCLDLVTSVGPRPSLLFGIDRPLYLSHHSPPARLAPDGTHVVHVARYLAPGEVPDRHECREELAEHAARAGITDAVIADQRHLHRMTVAGSLALAEHGGLAGRPAVRVPGLPAVFLAGDWVGPTGHLLDAAVASAVEAAHCADRAVDGVTLVHR